MKQSILIIALLCIGCGSTLEAEKAAINAHLSVVNYQRNVSTLVEAFISNYRNDARAKADQLADDAMRAEVGADGKANANNIVVIQNLRLSHYRDIEKNCVAMRQRFIDASADAVNASAYLEGLGTYFRSTADSSKTINQSSEALLTLLEDVIAAQKKGKNP